jgi:hypothetical protein
MSSRVALMGTNGTDTATAPVSAARREAVDRARQSWIRKLIDLSRRNNLMYYRLLKTGTLDLTSAESSGMATLLSCVEPVSIEKLLSNGKDWGFLNPKNHTIMQDLCDSWADIADPVKFGVPINDIFEHLDATIAEGEPLYELCASVLRSAPP